MEHENTKNKKTYKENQAISDDYKHTGYDRGHLNPNSFQYCDGRLATATLTNIAPMNACFNRVYWNEWEKTLKNFLGNMDEINKSATAFIVTGTVPSAEVKIPHREKPEDSNRVTVPSHIWTAVCYKHNSDDTKSFSFGYIGKNQPERDIRLMRVSDLNKELTKLYDSHSEITIFLNDCFGNNKLSMDKFQERIMRLDEEDTDGALKRPMSSESLASETNVKIRKVRIS